MRDVTRAVPGLPLDHLVHHPSVAADAKPPLLLLLHGVRSNERDLFSLTPELDPRWLIVSLRAPLERGPAAYAWFDVQFAPDGFVIDPDALRRSRDLVRAFIPGAVAAYGADPARVYLLGFSQGAILSLTTALSGPEPIAGVAALSGRIPPEATPWAVADERTAGLPVLQRHGRQDAVIGIEHAHRARAVLEHQRVALDYREGDYGHSIPRPILDDVNGWLAQRLAAPRWRPYEG